MNEIDNAKNEDRLERLSLPAEFVWPDYEGGSLANVPATVASLLGAAPPALPPLRPELWRPLQAGTKRVVLWLVDAWGWNLLRQERENLSGLLGQTAVTGQLTSIFPSTTVAALSSLWTGTAPAQHGLVGLRMLMPEYGVIGQMLKLSPTFASFPDSLVEAGLKPKEFLHTPGFGALLGEAGIPSYAFKGNAYVDSALSQMHGRGVTESYGIGTAADMLVQMRRLLEEKAGDPLYIGAYWPSVDSLSHVYGWDQPSVAAELHALMMQLQMGFLEKLSPAAREGTVLLILADHGQVNTPAAQEVYLDDHPALKRLLLMRPAGEPRVLYFYARQGAQAEVLAYLNEELGQALTAVSAPEALAAGLYGPEPHAPETAGRLGDVIAIMREGYVLLTEKDRNKKFKMKGRHGSMTQAEMLVPWLGFRLDG